MREEGVREQLNKSCNYSFTTLIFPADSPIEPDRTRPTATHAGTAHALFTGEWPFLFKDTMIQMCPGLFSLRESEQVERERCRGVEGAGDARLMWMLLMSTWGRVTFTHLSLSLSIHLCLIVPSHPFTH